MISVTGEDLPRGAEAVIQVCERRPSTEGYAICVGRPEGFQTVDATGRIRIDAYQMIVRGGVDCTVPPGCELAWYPGIGLPPYVTAPLTVAP